MLSGSQAVKAVFPKFSCRDYPRGDSARINRDIAVDVVVISVEEIAVAGRSGAHTTNLRGALPGRYFMRYP
jgi:hypothetical protein